MPAPALVQRTRPRRLRADKAYSTHDFRAVLAAMDCDPVIPSSSSWRNPPAYDKELYKVRADVECTFSLLKQARRFATRYEKTLRKLRRRRRHRLRAALATHLAVILDVIVADDVMTSWPSRHSSQVDAFRGTLPTRAVVGIYDPRPRPRLGQASAIQGHAP